MELLREGSRGAWVEYLQLALFRLGFGVTIDGVFGGQTKEAVLRLQREYGLLADGIVGRKTWAVLLPLLRGYNYYVVKPGDTLTKIAKAFFTTPERILLANPEVVPENLPVGLRLLVPYGFQLIPDTVSYTYGLVKLLVEGLRARYPFIRTGSAGSSVMGQNLYTLTIGEGENQVFFNASHHANEWITTPLLLTFLESYAEAYVNGDTLYGYSANAMYRATTLYLLPLVNPDGVDLVNGAVDMGSSFYTRALSYAQNYPQIPFPDGWKANIAGVDPNLSYPAYWERAQEIKFAQGYTSPAPRDYVGTAPLASPEAAAVYRFTQEHDFALTLSYHTQGEVIFWKFLDFLPPNSLEIGEIFARVSGYTLEETPYASSFAGYKDWFILSYNRPGYTIEAGNGVNPLPITQFPEIYADNLGILASALALFTERPDIPEA